MLCTRGDKCRGPRKEASIKKQAWSPEDGSAGKAPAAKPSDLSSIPGFCTEKERPDLVIYALATYHLCIMGMRTPLKMNVIL